MNRAFRVKYFISQYSVDVLESYVVNMEEGSSEATWYYTFVVDSCTPSPSFLNACHILFPP